MKWLAVSIVCLAIILASAAIRDYRWSQKYHSALVKADIASYAVLTWHSRIKSMDIKLIRALPILDRLSASHTEKRLFEVGLTGYWKQRPERHMETLERGVDLLLAELEQLRAEKGGGDENND